ncbi:MAG: 16S rRNA (adenine(1518)-N(6)/adenine(1519)-N(6))-dimethyltransferase RsmA [Alphaproteobacteria bacterium]|nr:16S rRNA (adenine(1518)-N(6)/adenine(1519)-N(6))-dimethyltransferase RsmA [Alphaproteobacteria bacterium]
MSDVEPATSFPPLREIIAQYGLGARRALGQHFLLDLNLTRRIASTPGDLANQTVVEIGPGPGGLTRALLETNAKHVYAIERDKRCIEALQSLTTAYPDRLTIIEQDALKFDFQTIPTDGKVTIVANLPYNISVPLLIGWLRQLSSIKSMTLMFQKEVADRLSAAPGSKSYGRTSVITQWLCDIDTAFTVPARAFVPPPKITSSVVRLTPRHQPQAEATFEDLERVTAAAFGQRRKMLRSALKSLVAYPISLLTGADINPEARAETLTVVQFCQIAENYRHIKKAGGA